MKIHLQIKNVITTYLPQLVGEEFDFQPAPENQPGDMGFGCFRLGGKLGMKPNEVAKAIAAFKFPSPVKETHAVGPYVNFTLERGPFATEVIQEAFQKGAEYGSNGAGIDRMVLLEHTSINPNASPHIGRARNGLIGDSLARMFRFEGYEVDVHYYVNDMGKQIGLLVLETEGREELSFDSILDEYVKANERAKQDPAFEAKGLELLMKMEEGDPEVKDAFTRLVDKCLNGQLEILGVLGLTYDTFDRESKYLKDPRMEEVFAALEGKEALFIDKDGRTVVDLAPLGWTREEGRYIVLMRANGSSMYMYRDIAYTLDKIERAKDYNFVVLGEDHKMYFEQLAMIVRASGHTPPEPIHYSYILLREGKMSTRQGNVVLLSDFLDEAVSRARAKVDEQWPELPENERAEISRLIGIGAVRFAVLSVRPNRNVIFDWETALNFNGDSGPYVQYSCTRITSILRKHGTEISPEGKEVAVTHDSEWKLVLRLALLENDIAAALAQRNPGILANSALETARSFSAFYTNCPVLNAPDERTRESRLLLCHAVRQGLVNLLGLLGIQAPERM